MKDNNKTQTEGCGLEGTRSSSATEIKTSYARVCIILLALNFCLTGYIMLNVMKLQSEATVSEISSTTQPVVGASQETKKLDTSNENTN